MSKHVTRRQFLGTSGKTAAGVAAGLSLAGNVTKAAGANEKFTVALIGAGGMGRYKMNNFMETGQCNIAAVCDVDNRNAAIAADMVDKKLGTKPKIVKDYRQVIDMKDVDIVIVGTPDHWHAPPMLLAVQAGKDVYCEKPCCHNIREGRAMVDAAAKYNRVVQVGTHQRSSIHINAAREYVQAGKLGKISMTHTFTYGNDFPAGLGDKPDEPVPKGVDYDMWLGAAPERPFNRRQFHNTWRWYFDYGCGMVGDWNVHLQDIIMWTMQTPYPISVASAGGHLLLEDDRDTPDTMQTVYEFPAAKLAPKGHVHTYTLRKASGKPWSAGGYGMDFHGTNGHLHVTRSGWSLDADREDWNKNDSPFRTESFEKPGTDSHPEHVANFLACVKSRQTPIASIELHYKTVVACHLANVSLRVGRKIFWDHEKELCFKDRALTIEDAQANALLGREYRKGYELPVV